jgi:hypothetical protein
VSPAVLYVLVFAVALLVNGALLALVEPIVLQMVLPTQRPWEAFIAFFPVVSLVGCAYALAAARLFRVRRQAALHLALLTVLLMWWGFRTDEVDEFFIRVTVPEWRLAVEGAPVVGALVLCKILLITVGVPLVALTGCLPLLQRWFAETGHPQGRDPYFLFACWCLGSLVGSLVYPILIEPLLSITQQGQAWLYGCGVGAALTVCCVVLLWRSKSAFPPPPGPEQTPAPEPAPTPAREALWPPAVSAVLRRLHWIALSAVPVALAFAQVTYVSSEVSAIPLFGLMALLLSQLTLLLAFARQPLFARLPRRVRLAIQLAHGMAILACLLGLLLNRPAGAGDEPGPLATGLWLILIPLGLLMPRGVATVVQPVTAVLLVFGVITRIWLVPALLFHPFAVFVAMRCCHSKLARDRPPSEGLVGYFLCMAVGAALGGFFVTVLAPLWFEEVIGEYGLALVLACMLRPGTVRNGLSDRLIARGLCALWKCGPAAARLTRFVAALVMDWLYPLLVGVLTVQLWLRHEYIWPNLTLWALPLALCLLAVGRPVRFGLSLGAVLLARSLAPGAPQEGQLTLLPGFGRAAPDSLLLLLLLLPVAVGAVVILASLFSVLLTDGRGDEPEASATEQSPSLTLPARPRTDFVRQLYDLPMMARAAFQPAVPITPPPGWAAEPHRYNPLTGV